MLTNLEIKKRINYASNKSEILILLNNITEDIEKYSDKILEDLFFNQLALIDNKKFDRASIPEIIGDKLKEILDSKYDHENFIDDSSSYRKKYLEA